MTDQMAMKQWRDIRKEAGLKIDPETAEVFWTYAQTLDPYGLDPNLPEECQQIGREYFARSPGTDIWVVFEDLPEGTRNALWEKHKRELAFPAGLFGPAIKTVELRKQIAQELLEKHFGGVISHDNLNKFIERIEVNYDAHRQLDYLDRMDALEKSGKLNDMPFKIDTSKQYRPFSMEITTADTVSLGSFRTAPALSGHARALNMATAPLFLRGTATTQRNENNK